MANKPIFMIVMLFASITSLFTITSLSSYSMDGVENIVYGSTPSLQGEENTGEENTGEENTGEENTGEENTGEENTGEENTGEENTGEEQNN
ncbi:MAG TPA: hypothetical protein VD815_03415, partial [Candidatus Saccharimonadales bacterium]|nr:hypothetical protein [Candidatus Saccharimonadales bacterium]